MRPKNLLLIMSDEHNPKMIGCADHDLVKTPRMDELATRGTRFSAAYTNCPICVPARASFATGRFIHDIRYWDNAMAYDGRVQGWGHRLQQAGIRVESIGKLHYRKKEDPTGFDVQHIPLHIKDGIGMVHGSIRGQFPDFKPPGTPGPPRIAQDAAVGETSYIKYDRKIAQQACDWIRDAAERADERPWVLYVGFVSPHYPLVVPAEYFNLYPIDELPDPKLDADGEFVPHSWTARMAGGTTDLTRDEKRRALAAYLGLCTFVDEQMGRVMDALEAAGLADTTRVVYTSDHGESAGSRGMWGKGVMYEEACGIPLIMAGDGVPEGKTCATPVSLVDGYQTILQAVGIEEKEADLPGRSWLDIANDQDDPERLVFSEYHAMRSPSAAYMIRLGRYKYHYYVGYEHELFDIVDDPEEMRNLAGDSSLAPVCAEYASTIREILDPETTDAGAKADQKALVERHGGPEAVTARAKGGKNFTEVPPEILNDLEKKQIVISN